MEIAPGYNELKGLFIIWLMPKVAFVWNSVCSEAVICWHSGYWPVYPFFSQLDFFFLLATGVDI